MLKVSDRYSSKKIKIEILSGNPGEGIIIRIARRDLSRPEFFSIILTSDELDEDVNKCLKEIIKYKPAKRWFKKQFGYDSGELRENILPEKESKEG